MARPESRTPVPGVGQASDVEPDGSPTRLTPTVVAAHLACRHLTQLERARREGRLSLSLPTDPHLDALIERGRRHEQASSNRSASVASA